jgi:hypothetical protein
VYASIEGPVTDGRLKLRSVALVPATATVGVPAIRLLSTASSVADSQQVDVLQLRARGDLHGADLLERAQAETRSRRRGEPPRVVDRRAHIAPSLDRHASDAELERWARTQPMMYSAPYSGIIAVY